jgi:hypothetical protein
MDLKLIFQTAEKEVNAAELADEFRIPAFQAAVQALMEAKSVGDTGRAFHRESARTNGDASDLERRLGVTAAELSEVFHFEPDRVELVVAPSRLPQKKASAMRDVALLIVSARQAGGIDDGWTEVSAIRDACRELGVLDAGNFAAEISQLGDVFNFRGTGRGRQVRTNAKGYERVSARIKELAGGDV